MDIYIFGASKLGRYAKNFLENRYNIVAFCDNNYKKYDIVEGLKVIGVDELIQKYKAKRSTIVIASMFFDEISKQLIELEINKEDINIFNIRMDTYDSMFNNLILNDEKIRLTNKTNVHLFVDSVHSQRLIEIINKNMDKSSNIFIVYNTTNPIYVKGNKNGNVFYLNVYNSSMHIFNCIKGCNKLFIHYLDIELAKFLNKYKIWNYVDKIYWGVFGGDLYPYTNIELYEKQTAKYVAVNTVPSSADKKYMQLVIKNIDFVLTSRECEYEIIKSNFNTEAEMIKFTYPLSINLKDLDNISNEKRIKMSDILGVEKVILLGNSATAENNHIEMINRLQQIDNGKFAIVCPLSYGCNNYAKQIIDYGKKVFSERFLPVTEFLDTKKYFELIQSVDIVIMNHIRQQAGANISAAIYFGKKVFLNSKSIFFKHFQSSCIRIFESDKISSYEVMIKKNEYRDANIIKFKEIYDEQKIKDKILMLLK